MSADSGITSGSIGHRLAVLVDRHDRDDDVVAVARGSRSVVSSAIFIARASSSWAARSTSTDPAGVTATAASASSSTIAPTSSRARVELDLQRLQQRVVGAGERSCPPTDGDALAPRPLAAGLLQRPQQLWVDAVALGGLGGAGFGLEASGFGLLGGVGRRPRCGPRRPPACGASTPGRPPRPRSRRRRWPAIAFVAAITVRWAPRRDRPTRARTMATTATTASTMTSDDHRRRRY